MVGTSVRDRTNEAIIANTTAIAIGANRKPATPGRKNIGTKAMQMHSSETKAGPTICLAPSRIASRTDLPCSRCQLMFSIVTVASSTRMPTASASPPSVMMLSVCPASASPAMAARMASGIEAAMMTSTATSREQQDHQAGQRGGDHAFAHHARHRRLHEDRLVGKRLDAQARRQRRLQPGHHRLHLIDDGDGRGRPALQHGHQDRARAVDAHFVTLRRRTVADMRHVAHHDGGPVDRPDRQVVERVDRVGAVVQAEIIFVLADFGGPGGHDLVLLRQRVRDIGRRQPMRLERGGIEVDLDLAFLAAIGGGDRRALYRGQRRADHVLPQVIDLLLGQPLARQSELQDRHGRGVVVQDQRRGDARRHLLQHGL